jgi:hypothetical protein
MDAELQAVIDHIIEQTRKNYEEEGELMPMFFLCKGKEITCCAAPFQNDQEKAYALNAVKQMARRMKADWCFHVTEAWMLKQDKKDGELYKGRVSEHPDKVEVVMFSLQVRGGEKLTAIAETTLLSSGKKTFGEVKLEKSDMQGRFTDILGEDSFMDESDPVEMLKKLMGL